ncbi:hypothetical protein J3F84DRAFT_164996 [Trichoderma pleuroticola]
MQEASHRLGSWSLEEASSGSSIGLWKRIIRLLKLQWRGARMTPKSPESVLAASRTHFPRHRTGTSIHAPFISLSRIPASPTWKRKKKRFGGKEKKRRE